MNAHVHPMFSEILDRHFRIKEKARELEAEMLNEDPAADQAPPQEVNGCRKCRIVCYLDGSIELEPCLEHE
jgi:hypothetical protein